MSDEYGYSEQSTSEEDEDVAIETTVEVAEDVYVSLDELVADGYEPEPDAYEAGPEDQPMA